MKIGQIVVKTAGRDGGEFAVVVDQIDDTYVTIDGNVRRKKCNIKHLEVLDKVIKIKERAEGSEVAKALKKEGIEILKDGKKRSRTHRPKKLKKKFSPKEDKKEEKKFLEKASAKEDKKEVKKE